MLSLGLIFSLVSAVPEPELPLVAVIDLPAAVSPEESAQLQLARAAGQRITKGLRHGTLGSHPHIVTVHDVGTENGTRCIRDNAVIGKASSSVPAGLVAYMVVF